MAGLLRARSFLFDWGARLVFTFFNFLGDKPHLIFLQILFVLSSFLFSKFKLTYEIPSSIAADWTAQVVGQKL